MQRHWLQRTGIVTGVVAACVGCASRGSSPDSAGRTSPSAMARQDAEQFKAQARQGLTDFVREKPTPPPCESGYLTGRQLTVLATSEWIERAGLRRGDRIASMDGVRVADLQDHARLQARVAPGTPFTVVVVRGGREVALTLACVAKPEVWLAARRTQEAAALGDWDACQAFALDYILATGYIEALALEFHGRCGFHRALLRGERFNLDLARDLYEWQVYRVREKSYEPGGLDEIRESVLSGVAVLRREGFREHADNLEEQLRTAPGRVAAETARSPVAQAPASPPPQVTPPAPSPPLSPPVRPPPAPAPRASPAPGPRVSQGTAFFVRPDGVLLTALHVVDGARTIMVACPGRDPASATLSDRAAALDLAVLKTSLAAATYLSIRDARSVQLGEAIFSVGFPAAGTPGVASKVADGSVLAVSGPDTETAFLQMTVPVQPGNLGGPVVAADGSVVGVVSSSAAIIPLMNGPAILPQNVNWAIKADQARPLFQQPPASPSSKSRSEAIERATRAACQVLATK